MQSIVQLPSTTPKEMTGRQMNGKKAFMTSNNNTYISRLTLVESIRGRGIWQRPTKFDKDRYMSHEPYNQEYRKERKIVWQTVKNANKIK